VTTHSLLKQSTKGQSLFLSTYERELLSLVTAVQKWRPYLLGQSFRVKTDQQALKFLLEQRAGTISQQRWISKLLGYDFVIEYKKGKENKVADAFSHKFEEVLEIDTLSISLISFPTLDWIEDLQSFLFTTSRFQGVTAETLARVARI
jgi:hypothetical protein